MRRTSASRWRPRQRPATAIRAPHWTVDACGADEQARGLRPLRRSPSLQRESAGLGAGPGGAPPGAGRLSPGLDMPRGCTCRGSLLLIQVGGASTKVRGLKALELLAVRGAVLVSPSASWNDRDRPSLTALPGGTPTVEVLGSRITLWSTHPQWVRFWTAIWSTPGVLVSWGAVTHGHKPAADTTETYPLSSEGQRSKIKVSAGPDPSGGCRAESSLAVPALAAGSTPRLRPCPRLQHPTLLCLLSPLPSLGGCCDST